MIKALQSVLVVDDQENWRKLLEEVLKDEFEVTAVANYEQALNEIYNKTPPHHVVITDMRLIDTQGDEHGLQLIEQLKKGSTKAIIITGYPTITSLQRAAFDLQVSYYFEKFPSSEKSFDPGEFLQIVRQAAIDAELSRKSLAFILMPFADEYKAFYENEIKKTIEAMGLSCKRVDDFYSSRRIMSDIQECIKDSKLILADLTGRNANVFFEVGIAHALGKNVLLLTQNLNDVPRRLRTVRCIEYEKSWAGAAKFVPKLEKAVLEIQSMNYHSFFGEKNIGIEPKHCFALMPSNQLGSQIYTDLVLRVLRDSKCKATKSEEIFNSVSVLDELWIRLNTAELIVADLSGRDTDVFYLVGLAYGLGKKIIYLAQNEADIPFDLQEGSCLIYSTESYELGLQAKQKLTQLVKELLG